MTVATAAPIKTKAIPETVRQAVLADQAAAQAAVAAARTETAAQPGKTKPTKPKASTPAKVKVTKTAKTDTRRITILAKTNPHAPGSRRAGWFKQLKNGMTVDEAIKAGMRSVYLQRMSAKQIIKLA